MNDDLLFVSATYFTNNSTLEEKSYTIKLYNSGIVVSYSLKDFEFYSSYEGDNMFENFGYGLNSLDDLLFISTNEFNKGIYLFNSSTEGHVTRRNCKLLEPCDYSNVNIIYTIYMNIFLLTFLIITIFFL